MSARDEPVALQEAVHVGGEVAAHHVRHVRVQHDPQTRRRHVPAHRALGVRVEVAPRAEHLHASRAVGDRCLARAAHRDHGRRAVPEEPAGHQVGHRHVVALHGQRAQLDRHQHGHLVGVADEVVVEPRDPGRPRHAAESHERDALHVGAEAEDAGDPGVERRHGEPGDRRGDDQVDVGRGEAGLLEGVRHRLRAELDAHLDEPVVGLPEVREVGVVGQRHRQVALPHAGVGVQPAQQLLVEPAPGDHTGEGVGDHLLGVAVLGQGPSDRQDLHGVLLSRVRDGRRGRRVGPRSRDASPMPSPRPRRGVISPWPSPISTRSSKTRWSRAAAWIPASTKAGRFESREATNVCRRCRASSRRTDLRCSRPARAGVALRDRLGRRASGQDPGRHRVVDALAGHRVDQPRRVAGDQHRPLRLVPPPVRERQVVPLPALAAGDRPGKQPLELVEQQRPRGRRPARRRAARRTRRWTGRRRGRRPRRTTAGGGRRTR